MGGTFDPIHFGHIAIAEAVLHKFAPQRVLFIPAGKQPLKLDKPVTDGEHRFKMTLSAVCQNPAFDVSRMEIDREGPSYTVDTIEDLRRICPKKAQIFFIIGADAITEILSWEGAERLLKLCELIAVKRPGYELSMDFIENLRKKYSAIIHVFEGPLLEISGTEVREKIIANEPVGGLMPRIAEDYARRHGLFQTFGTSLTPEKFDAAKSRLEMRLSAKRFRHTLGTIIESEKLAAHYGADINKARWAALLHDCAKEFSAAKKRILCEIWNIPLDEILYADIDIAHSYLGAESAKRDYQVEDPEILQAIHHHTTGSSNMAILDKIIMLADFIEPYREPYPPLEEMRRQAYIDIDKALVIGMKYTISDLIKRKKPIHQHSKDALNSLKR